jgi:hypothetical protein
MRKHTKKLAVAAAAISVLIAGGAAFAYFTNSGSGTGSASVGTSSAITISASAPDNLYPDGPGRDVTIIVTNPGAGSQYVDTVHFVSATDTDNACDTTVFSMPDVLVDQDLAAGASTTVHGTLSMADNNANQDSCQGDALTLHLTSN